MKSLLALLKDVRGFLDVLAQFGITQSIVGGGSALVLGFLGFLDGLPISVIVFIAFVTFVFGAIFCSLIIFSIKNWGKRPHYDVWDKVDPLHIWQAGCLWGKEEPTLPLTGGRPRYGFFHLIKRAVEAGELEAIGPPETHFMWKRVSREGLKKLAEKMNEHPPFLYPDAR